MTGTSRARAVGMAMVLSLVTAGAAVGQPSGSEGRRIEGTWYVEITPRNCLTGAAIAPPVNSLVTFAPGGTLSETASGGAAFAIGQRSQGHGTWRHDGGHRYSQAFTTMINFTTAPGPTGPGFLAGWQIVNHTVELVDADHLESTGTNAFYDLNWVQYRAGCSSATARRFQ